MYKILKTEEFKKSFEKLDNSIKLRFDKQIKILETNPFIGKPLKNNKFRELRVKKFRLYYMIRDKSISILLIDVSGKIDQQETIDEIYYKLEYYFNI